MPKNKKKTEEEKLREEQIFQEEIVDNEIDLDGADDIYEEPSDRYIKEPEQNPECDNIDSLQDFFGFEIDEEDPELSLV